MSILTRIAVCEPQTYDLFGFRVTPMTKGEIIGLLGETIAANGHCVIASQNLHGVYVYFSNQKFRELHQQAYVHIDGMPIVWLAQIAGLPVKAEHRTGWIDWFLPLMKEARRQQWRVFYLGAEREVLENGLKFIRTQYLGIQIEGHHGFFNATPGHAENEAVVKQINDFKPNLLIVGMGMGRQCAWILDNMDRLDVNCIGTAGACIEYFANAARVPPRWLGPIGMEWIYRFATNPRRFAWRYLVEPWLVLGYLVRHAVVRKRTPRSVKAANCRQRQAKRE